MWYYVSNVRIQHFAKLVVSIHFWRDFPRPFLSLHQWRMWRMLFFVMS